MVIALNSFAQERIVRGKVTSAEDDSGIPGANVMVKGTSIGAVTDGSGNYSISLPATGGTTLIFSFIGFQTQEMEVGARTEIDVKLNVDVTQLSEVVVTSFGIEKSKQSLGYAVQSVGAKELAEARQPNIVSALQGQVAGVQITNTGGGPGMGARIVVRGLTSLNPRMLITSPLFIVDGVPIDNTTSDNATNCTRYVQPGSRY
jgi:outer membrane receptor protein involved in Fe transport